MDFPAMPEMVNGLPNLCGADAQVEAVTRSRQPVFLPETNLRLDRLPHLARSELRVEEPCDERCLPLLLLFREITREERRFYRLITIVLEEESPNVPEQASVAHS